ncbi:hypothetical protein Mal33_01150 [Rosistilla oblonga]|uniref:Uncharacterized protein n=1 Tax=Rosistilla oblonga TaxID=2527990 RepID=A0A518IM44_9BACT|nr:hypothetical protein Mal33_01150 [Rosistilla oblonga]
MPWLRHSMLSLRAIPGTRVPGLRMPWLRHSMLSLPVIPGTCVSGAMLTRRHDQLVLQRVGLFVAAGGPQHWDQLFAVLRIDAVQV